MSTAVLKALGAKGLKPVASQSRQEADRWHVSNSNSSSSGLSLPLVGCIYRLQKALLSNQNYIHGSDTKTCQAGDQENDLGFKHRSQSPRRVREQYVQAWNLAAYNKAKLLALYPLSDVDSTRWQAVAKASILARMVSRV